ncbi:MAG: glycosyltransferase family 25 protein [Chitinophagaceae bacterium]|nr:MAG: glycosyltransferase family 25 protein [Chitinophagaceae bacterium]
MKDRQAFFSALNAFFDHIYVITLKRAADRHEHIRKELAGLHYELFFGHDKQEFSIEKLKQEGIYDEGLARQHHRYGKPMPAGMIGCSWSHAEVYRDIMKKGYQKALILEDDVVIDESATTVFSSVINQLPADWELFYLGFAEKEKTPPFAFLKRSVYHAQRFIGKLNYSHKTISNLYPRKLSANVYKAGYHDCTHAYAVTQSGAEKLLRLQTPISFFPDNLLAHAATNELVNAYIILPKIIYQQYQVGTSSASYINH